MKYSLQQLSEKADVPERSIRFYIQKGLLPRPQGEKRGAFYDANHLADLLRIRQWQHAGLSLDAIGDLLQTKQEAPVTLARPGSIEVRSHLTLGDGIELVVAPERAGLSQTQLRRLFESVRGAYTDIVDGKDDA
jgi:DNA-binding transcriptional MerR regulator